MSDPPESLFFRSSHRYPAGFELDVELETGGGVTALFGPSGSGKSTVLGIIAGLIRPREGLIRLGERVLVDTAKGFYVPPDRRGIGLVFQDHLLFPHLSVEANLRFGLHRRPSRRIELQRVVEVLELGTLLERLPRGLSGGERQRTALGRALLRGPELLLMDEPVTSLDEALKDRILSYLERAFREWRIPTIFVSHDQSDVRRLAERVVVLEDGKVVDQGETAVALDRAVTLRMSSRPGPTNLLRVEELRRVEGSWEGRIGGQRFQLAPDSPIDGTSTHIAFFPRDVALSREEVPGLSVRNQLRGKVREIMDLPGRVFVAIDIGQFLWAEVTREAVRDLDLRPGAAVTCLIKTSAVRVAG